MEKETIDRIEQDLLRVFLKYLVVSKEKKQDGQIKSEIERIVQQKITFKEIINIERIIQLDSTTIKANNKTIDDRFEHFFEAIRKTTSLEEVKVTIKYEHKSNVEKIAIETENNGKKYSFESKSENPFNMDYGLTVLYERKHGQERISISYYEQAANYLINHITSKEDMSQRVPLKWINIFHENQMPGVLGFTYIGDHSMGRRADLTGSMARMVDIHESIHTPDEYETRILTDWIMERPTLKYKR